MKKRTVVFLIIGTVLFLVGGMIFVGAMSAMKWDFLKLDNRSFVTDIHVINEEFDGISIISDYTDVIILPSENGECSVKCFEYEKARHTVGVKDGTLEISIADERKWSDHISVFNFKTPKITVYLPENEYGRLYLKTGADIKVADGFTFESFEAESVSGDVACQSSVGNVLRITVTSGDVALKSITAGSLEVKTTSGDVLISDIRVKKEAAVEVGSGDVMIRGAECDSLALSGISSDVVLKDVVAAGRLSVKTVSGDVELEGIDGEYISIKATSGDVEGYVYTDKTFVCKTTSGDCEYPKTSGGICEIETTSGDIEISIRK